MLEYPLLYVFPVAMIFAAWMDVFTMTIPNKVSLALLFSFIFAAPLSGVAWEVFFSHLAAGFLTLLVGIFLFSRGWVGGGDAKLLAATVLWLGFEQLLTYTVLVAILGGVLALVIMGYRNILPPKWLLSQQWAMRLHDPKIGIPYGVALAAAGLWLYPSSRWFEVMAV